MTAITVGRDGCDEDVIEPDLAIIDCHHHIWPDRFSEYVGLFGKATVADVVRDIEQSGHRVLATVHITHEYPYRTDLPPGLIPVAETQYLEDAARAADLLNGDVAVASAIVAGADLLLGERIEAVLDGHAAASPGRFRGVRGSLAWHPSPLVEYKYQPGLLANENLIESARRLAARNLSLDVFVYYNQLPEVAGLARAVPDLRIILNHLGTPLVDPRFGAMRDSIRCEWEASLHSLAAHPNVVVKLGGMGMPIAAGDLWSGRDAPPSSSEYADFLRPFILHAVDCFGTDRAMFESNFPTDSPSAPYRTVWNAFKTITRSMTADEKNRLYFSNAAIAYGISLSPDNAT